MQAVADNFDCNICSTNELKQTHSLARMMLQNRSEDEWTKYPSIKRLPKNEIINVNLPEIETIQLIHCTT